MGIVAFEPIYYLGWVIQPTQRGYVVYDREDRSREITADFPTMREAEEYIDGKMKKH